MRPLCDDSTLPLTSNSIPETICFTRKGWLNQTASALAPPSSRVASTSLTRFTGDIRELTLRTRTRAVWMLPGCSARSGTICRVSS